MSPKKSKQRSKGKNPGVVNKQEPRAEGENPGVVNKQEPISKGKNPGVVNKQEARAEGENPGVVNKQEPRAEGENPGVVNKQEPRSKGENSGVVNKQEPRAEGKNPGVVNKQEPISEGENPGVVNKQGPRSKEGFPGVIESVNIKDNGRIKLLIIGKTGTGKSSLCNVITGYDHDADIYPVSAEGKSCTQRTQFADVFFDNDPTLAISLIDTIGFDDANNDDDAAIIAEIVDKLNKDCDHINLFLIAVHGQNARLDGSLVGIIRIFEGMFTEKFWKQALVVFTHVPMNEANKERRNKITKMSDEEKALKYMELVRERFPNGKYLKHVFLDATYDKGNSEESKAFKTGLAFIRRSLENAPNIPTSHVREVETENAKLKRQIQESEKAREKAEADYIKLTKEMYKQALCEKKRIEEEMEKLKEDQKAQVEKGRKYSEEQFNKKMKEMEEEGKKKEMEFHKKYDDMKKTYEQTTNRPAPEAKGWCTIL